jgi:hypothetical protein
VKQQGLQVFKNDTTKMLKRKSEFFKLKKSMASGNLSPWSEE